MYLYALLSMPLWRSSRSRRRRFCLHWAEEIDLELHQHLVYANRWWKISGFSLLEMITRWLLLLFPWMQLPLICSFHRFKLPDKLQEKTVCTIEAVRTWESTCPVSVVTRRPGEQSKPNEFDLRQVGLLPVNKGDQLKLIKVYMGPRILAQNQHGECE